MSFAKVITSYEPVADEYYDEQRHPTCQNFGELSSRFFRFRLRKLVHSAGTALEIGTSKSVLAEIFEQNIFPCHV